MPEENVELVRRLVAPMYEAGEPDWGVCDPGVVLVSRPDGSALATFRGLDEVRRGWREVYRDIWTDLRVLEPPKMVSEGDVVIALTQARLHARASGIELEIAEAWVYWVRDGKITRIEQHGPKEEALEAAGLSEGG